MTYSSALFAEPEMTLEDAQREKYRTLAGSTGIRAGDRVLEIGSGWGGFARYLAGEVGAEVTTVTVSREQAAFVGDLMSREGLSDRVEVRLEDFLETSGSYDAIVSVEMIESIPSRRWPEYFRTIRDRLAPEGRVGLQIITVADRHWEVSDTNPDFVRRYIFPGGQIPAPSVLRRLAADNDLSWISEERFGWSYARTLAGWRERFDAAWPQIAKMGFDERFRRMWRYYLAYCEGGFRSGRIDVEQIVLSGASWR
jgi:cyclopropane-fatty-acyl-phospholipid synthase